MAELKPCPFCDSTNISCQTQDIKQIFGLFNVKIAVRHFRISIVKQRLLKLGTGELKMSNEFIFCSVGLVLGFIIGFCVTR